MADRDTEHEKVETKEPVGGGDPRPRRNWSGIAAAVLVLALAGWMASGMLFEEEEEVLQAPQRASEPQPVAVEIRTSSAQTVTRFLNSEGEVRPEFATPVRAEAAGVVESLALPKGVRVEEGDPIATIAPAEREAQLAQARAELRRTQRDLEAVERLAGEGFSTTSRLEQARAAVAAAEAQVASATEAVRDTTIRAPASGILNELMIDRGEVVAPGEEVARIVNTDPLIVEIRVPQRSVGQVETGRAALVEFVTGQERQGRVRYVSANAEAATRTFAVEIEVPNPQRDVPAGISAEVRVPLEEVAAHFVSPAILSLGEGGALGVKTVGEDMRVNFHEVELVRAQTDGIWITGLPSDAAIISVGQGFVAEGELVEVSESGIERLPGEVPSVPQVSLDSELPVDMPEEIEAEEAVGAISGEMEETTSIVVPSDDEPSSPADTSDPLQAATPAVSPVEEPAEPGVLADSARGETMNGGGDDTSVQTVPFEERDDATTQAIPATPAEPLPQEPVVSAEEGTSEENAAPPLPQPEPLSFEDEPQRERAVRAVQEELAGRGYEPGPVDGLLGPSTRGAIRQFEEEQDMPVTGDLTPALLSALEVDLE